VTTKPAPPLAKDAILAVLPASPQPVGDVLPVNAEPSGPSRTAYLFAREQGIDPDEVFERQVEDEAMATRFLQHWKEEIPAVPSAYQPSGVLPAKALLLMIVGSVVGVGAGLLAGGLVATLGGTLVVLVGYLIALMVFCGFIWCFAVVVGGILALAVAAGTFVVAGWMSALCTTQFGRWGKNRNIRAAAILSVLSSVLAIAIAWVLYYVVGKPLLAERGMTDYSDLIAAIVAVLGGGIAAFSAGIAATEQVRAAKFCEDCECYMDEISLKRLCLGGLRILLHALGQARIDVAGSLLHDPPGEDAEVKLFSCSSCSRGYLEATIQFKAEWKKKKDKEDKEDKTESWLAASRELAAADVEHLRTESLRAAESNPDYSR